MIFLHPLLINSPRKLPAPLQSAEILLAQCLIGDNRHRIGKIEASCLINHGDSDAPLGIRLHNPLGQAFCLAAEEQKNLLLIIGKIHLAINLLGLGGAIIDFAPPFGEGGEFFIIFMDGKIQILPIIQACPPDRLLIYGKTQGLDQMQRTAGGSAGAGDIAGILRDLRLY